eukprot:4245618-Pyramimonas_sp.AAC.1
MDRPGKKPRWSSTIFPSTIGSSTRRTALAKRRLSQLVTLSGRAPLAAKAGTPCSVAPAAFFGRKKSKLSLKPRKAHRQLNFPKPATPRRGSHRAPEPSCWSSSTPGRCASGAAARARSHRGEGHAQNGGRHLPGAKFPSALRQPP